MVQESIDTVVREVASALDSCTTTSNVDIATNTEQTILRDDDYDENFFSSDSL